MSTSTGTITTSAGPLDVQGLVGKIMGAESSVLQPLTQQASSYNSLISAYGGLKSAVSTYQTALNGISTSTLNSQKATVVNNGSGGTTDPFTADITPDDATKNKAQKLQSATVPAGTIFNANDSLAIKIGNNPPKFLTLAANSTLSDLRDKINASSLGATASITTDNTGDHLTIESNTAGNAGVLKIQANNSLAGLAYDPSSTTPSSMTQTQAARDASTAVSGSYAVAVQQLAQAQKITSTGFPEGTQFGAGILAIKTGNGSTTIIHPTSNSVAGLRDAINASNSGVTASIVSDNDMEHLVIAANESGTANMIKINGTGSYSALNFDPGGSYNSPGVSTRQLFDSNNGDITLNVDGKTTAVALGSGSMTLTDVRDAVNSAKAGVTASISNDGTQDHLVLTPDGKKTTSPIALKGTGDFASLSGNSMGQLSAAQDAKLSIDGVSVTSKSNKVANAIAGVTLNLTKVTADTDNVSLSIANDTTGITKTADTFVSAYNTLVKAVGDMTKQTPSTTPGKTGKSGPLASETAVQNMLSQMRSAVFSNVSGGKDISSLSDVGISVQKDGTLQVDAAKLNAAATKNFAGVANLFTAGASKNPDGTNDTSKTDSADGNDKKNIGILTKLQTLVDGFLADGGIIDSKTKGLQASLRVNSDRQTAINSRLSTKQDSYTNQFNSLNGTLSSMASTQSYLTQQLSSLQKQTNG